jgi:alpha-aminoadipate/glutamate carrier protein LysW
MSAICPECDSPIDVDEYDVDIGDELTCSECGSLLRVSSDSPLEFELADDDDDIDDEEEEEKDDDDAAEDEDEDLDDTDDDEDDDRIDEDE